MDSLSDFKQPGRTHASTDAHGDHHVFHATALAFDQRMAYETCAGDAIRVAHGNRAAINVEAAPVLV